MNHDTMIASLISTKLIAKLLTVADNEEFTGSIQYQTLDIAGAIAMTTDVAEVKRRVFNDPRVQEALKQLVEDAVDAATYMRY